MIEKAVNRSRTNAARQLAIGVLVGVSFVVWPASAAFTLIVAALNVIINLVMARRWWRLRRIGPAVTALLRNPEDVALVAGWPAKVPPNKLPIFLEVHTRSGHQCTILLDAKKPAETNELVHALHARSPDAIITVPNLPCATLA